MKRNMTCNMTSNMTCNMTANLLAAALVSVISVAAPTLALANSHHHHRHQSPVGLYGYGSPSCDGRSPTCGISYGNDPAPQLNAQLRRDREHGVDYLDDDLLHTDPYQAE
jgi:hypothetical protein